MEVKSKLTLEEQIQVLENIDWEEMKRERLGLCFGIQRSLLKKTFEIKLFAEIPEFIPIFKRENALPFRANKTASFWWERFSELDYVLRKAFVNWMIEDLELQIIERDKKKMKKFFKDFIYILTIFGIMFAVTMFMIYFKK